MKKLEAGAVEGALADLQALREFCEISARHMPKLDRAIGRLEELLQEYRKNHGRK